MGMRRRNFFWLGATLVLPGQTPVRAYTLTAPVQEGLVPDWWLPSLGLELLSGDDPTRQYCSWYGQTISLTVVPGPPQIPGRYIKLTDLQPFGGGRITPGGLEITASAAQCTLGPNQLTLTLSRPVPWSLSPTGVLTLIAQLQLPAHPRLTQLNPNQIQISGPVAITALNNPYQLVINLNPTPTPRSLSQRWPRDLSYDQLDFLNPLPQRVHLLTLPPTKPGQLIRAPDKKTLTALAQQAGALAALNGGFFHVNSGQPLGALRIDGQWQAGPILGRGAVGWDSNGCQFDRLSWQGTLTTPRARLALVGWNTAYYQAGISVYTPEWGPSYTCLAQQEIIFKVQDNYSQLPITAQRGTALGIPPQGQLLVGRGYGIALLQEHLKDPQPVRIDLTLTPPPWQNLPHILGAGPLLLKDGQQVLDGDLEKFQPDVKDSRAPRTALGRKQDGRLIWAVAEGRFRDAVGLTLGEWATFLQGQGCVDALNLDGGGSTGLYLGGMVRNRLNGPERLLSNALLFL